MNLTMVELSRAPWYGVAVTCSVFVIALHMVRNFAKRVDARFADRARSAFPLPAHVREQLAQQARHDRRYWP